MKKVNINTLLYILILLFVVVLIMCRCISLHQNITENFEDTVESIQEDLNKTAEQVNQHLEDHDTGKAGGCPKPDDGIHGSIISKYSGKIMNVENLEGEKYKDGNTEYNVYIIKWQPLGGKPGGCITCNSDGTFSTPICNLQNNEQKWYIKKIENESQWKKEIKEERRVMGRNFSSSNTEYPFYIIISKEYNEYVLNYEGGGLSIREKANYDGQKWDVSPNKIKQDPLPTHPNSKFAGLTPGHAVTNGDKTLGGAFNSPLSNRTSGNGSGNGSGNSNGDGTTNLNVNLDPDLLSKLNFLLNNEGGLNGFGGASGSNNSSNNSNIKDLLKNNNGRNSNGSNSANGGNGGNMTGGRGDISDMLRNSNDKRSCTDCGKIPEKYIKKDLVKSMCIGCNNIDNVLT